jgi:hypothetical protein
VQHCAVPTNSVEVEIPDYRSEPVAKAARPETFRLPRSAKRDEKGNLVQAAERDPFFGLTRDFYYAGENRGYWKLIRLCQPGKERGVTLVPFDDVQRFINERSAKK